MSDFDEEYAKRVGEKCFKAILGASLKNGELQLSEPEIYDGVVSAIAMIHSSQDDIPSDEKTQSISEIIARLFRERAHAFKAAREQGESLPSFAENRQ